MAAVKPTQEVLFLFQEIYNVFRADGSWPVHQYLDTRLDQKHGLVLDQVLEIVPDDTLRIHAPVGADSEVMLRVAGMLHCDGVEGDIALFERGLRWCVEREANFQPKSPTRAEQLNVPASEAVAHWTKEGVDVSETDFAKLRAMFAVEWIDVSLNGSPGNWCWAIHKEIRRFRAVRNVYEYLTLIAEDPPAAQPSPILAHRPPPQPRLVTRNAEPTQAVPALSVGDLHPLVHRACSKLFAGEHYREGVLKAAMALRDLVREKTGLRDEDDSTLMGKALSRREPKIVLADLSTETGRNIQRGTGHLAEGIVARFRNVLTHEGKELDRSEALEMAALISRVVRDVEAGTVDGNSKAPQ